MSLLCRAGLCAGWQGAFHSAGPGAFILHYTLWDWDGGAAGTPLTLWDWGWGAAGTPLTLWDWGAAGTPLTL